MGNSSSVKRWELFLNHSCTRWRTTSFDDVNITLTADAEVNGPGFRLKYAFDGKMYFKCEHFLNKPLRARVFVNVYVPISDNLV